MAIALDKLVKGGLAPRGVLREAVAATSVGCLEGGEPLLDLVYVEDSKAAFDLNVVATESGAIVELQGTAEAAPLGRREVDAMVDLALTGVRQLIEIQRRRLARVGGGSGVAHRGREDVTQDHSSSRPTTRARLAELRALLAGVRVRAVSVDEVVRTPPRVVEDGRTFAGTTRSRRPAQSRTPR